MQLAIVARQTYFAKQDLHVSYVTHHTRTLLARLKSKSSGVEIRTRRVPAHYRDDEPGAYAFRILTDEGRVIKEHNGDLLRKFSPWSSGSQGGLDLWIVDIDPSRRLFVAGGTRQHVGEATVLIEVATRGDPKSTVLAILAKEIFDDVWMPMLPVIFLTIGAAVFSVRRSMRPLADMAAKVEQSSSAVLSFDSGSKSLPREVVSFVVAIAELLKREQDLLRSQRAFIARAAHELRTPLSAMMLEVELVSERGTARLETDIKKLSTLVDRLMTLARLEAKECADPRPVNLAVLADETIDQFKLLLDASDHRVVLTVNEPVDVVGDAPAILEIIRNLVENAAKHTPAGTRIGVTVGPGSIIAVEDNGPGWGRLDRSILLKPFTKGLASSDGSGLGLSIVSQAADLLGAELILAPSETGGAKVTVQWDSGNLEYGSVAR